MKFKQEQLEFKPISIILETKQEVESLVSLVDKLDGYKMENTQFTFTPEEWEIVLQISNHFFEDEV